MDEIINLSDNEAIKKLKELAGAINICMFCTNIQNDNGAVTRPMATQISDKDDYLWFITDKNSHKNREIAQDNKIQLFYSDPGKSSFVEITGTAEVVFDQAKVDELWNPFMKTWFQEGKDDPNISLIKVQPKEGNYWDNKGNRMTNFFRMMASVVVGKDLVDGEEGEMKF
ncbi:MAG: ral stress protein [Ferruginibacter sp.]|nr:ral stress protein [Ferruginibacter sp.]